MIHIQNSCECGSSPSYFGSWRAKLIEAPHRCQNEFDAWYWADIVTDCSISPPYLQACTGSLPNMDGVVCETTSFRRKAMSSYILKVSWFWWHDCDIPWTGSAGDSRPSPLHHGLALVPVIVGGFCHRCSWQILWNLSSLDRKSNCCLGWWSKGLAEPCIEIKLPRKDRRHVLIHNYVVGIFLSFI